MEEPAVSMAATRSTLSAPSLAPGPALTQGPRLPTLLLLAFPATPFPLHFSSCFSPLLLRSPFPFSNCLTKAIPGEKQKEETVESDNLFRKIVR